MLIPRVLTLFTILFAYCATSPVQAGSSESRIGLDEISKANIDRALSVLKKSAAGQALLTDDELARATLAGLLERHPTLLRVRDTTAKATKEELPSAMYLFDGIVYWRPGDLNASNKQAFERDLDRVEHAGAFTIVLDLRATAAKQDPDLAMTLASLFLPGGEELFRWVGAEARDSRVFISNHKRPLLDERLVVLIDADIAGVGEAVAAVLRERPGTILVGQSTSGLWAEAGFIEVQPGFELEIGRGEYQLADGVARVGQPVEPHVEVLFSWEGKLKAFQIASEKGIPALVEEVERPRFNEAALVGGINPELAEIERVSANSRRPDLSKKSVDPVLKRGLDLARSLLIYRLNLQQAGEEEQNLLEAEDQ